MLQTLGSAQEPTAHGFVDLTHGFLDLTHDLVDLTHSGSNPEDRGSICADSS